MGWNEGFSLWWYLYFYCSVRHEAVLPCVVVLFELFVSVLVPRARWHPVKPALLPCVVSTGGCWALNEISVTQRSPFWFYLRCYVQAEGHFGWNVDTLTVSIWIYSTDIICLNRSREESGGLGGSDWSVPWHTKAPCCNLVVSPHCGPFIFIFLNYAALVWAAMQCVVFFKMWMVHCLVD